MSSIKTLSVQSKCCAEIAATEPFIIRKFSHSPYVLQRNTCLSCDPEAMMSPVGLNLHENTSPACPVSSMMGARSPEVLAGPCNSFISSDSSASYCIKS